jgi:hypothetical protein
MAQEESRGCSPPVGTPLSRLGESTVCEEDRRRHGLFLGWRKDACRIGGTADLPRGESAIGEYRDAAARHYGAGDEQAAHNSPPPGERTNQCADW